jgi:hypothetical protein
MSLQSPPPQAPPLNVDLRSATDVVCDSCGSRLFREVMLIKRVSALVSPNGKEMLAPVATFACAKCGHLNDAFDPFREPEQG